MTESNSLSFVCEFCEKRLSSIGNLKRHTKTSKSCLQMRGENYSTIELCPDCKYGTALKANLLIHFGSCKSRKIRLEKEESKEKKRLEEDVIKLKAENNIMKQQLLEERSRPQVVNNQFNITFNLQIEHSQRVLSPYSKLEKEQHRILEGWFRQSACRNGIKGLARVITGKLLTHDGKKWMISYEPDKTAFHRKNDNEEIEIDDKAEKFFKSLIPTIDSIAKKHLVSLINDASDQSEMKRLNDVGQEFRAMLDEGTPERKKIVRMIANGICMSRSALLSANSVRHKAKLEFCDELPNETGVTQEDSSEWFATNDPEFQKWKKETEADRMMSML